MRSAPATHPLDRAGGPHRPPHFRPWLSPLLLLLLPVLLWGAGACGNDPIIIPSDDDTESPTPETPSPTPEATPSPTPSPTPTPLPCQDPGDVQTLCEAINLTPVYYQDQDGDGFGDPKKSSSSQASGYIPVRGDCNDTDRNVHPGADDPDGDGKDQDCGGTAGPDPHVGFSSSSRISIQRALDAAGDGITVFVAPGTYREHDLNFLSRGIRLMSTHGASETVIDAERLGRGFVFQTFESALTVVDGFKIIRGAVCGGDGGGIYINGASPTFQGNVICGNQADTLEFNGGDGGGIYLRSSSSTLSGNLIAHNRGDLGGGMAVWTSSPALTDSTFASNAARANGGGLAMFDSSGTVRHVTFADNQANQLGGGAHLQTSSPTVSQCLFSGNRADQADGGGLYLGQSNATISNSLFYQNSAGWGGGIWVSASSPALTNLALYDNEAVHANGGGGGLYLSNSSPVITACVLFRNTSIREGSAGGLEIQGSSSNTVKLTGSILAYNGGYNLAVDAASGEPQIEVTYSDLYTPGTRNHTLSSLSSTNLTVEPGLLSSGESAVDLHLSKSSPLVNAGDPGLEDPDGSWADMGMFSGPEGAKWDLDHDGSPGYFWPGSYTDSPAGVDRSGYDCDDRNASAGGGKNCPN